MLVLQRAHCGRNESLITRITGKLVRLTDHSATLEVGACEHELFVPEFVRRQLQSVIGETISLRTIEYLEGNPQQGRLIPRMVGFMTDAEREFFELFCSVDGVGVRKALRAMVRPVREVAIAIEEQDLKQLSTLPGVGPAVGERIVAKLRRKMARFALMVARDLPDEETVDRDLLNETFEALVSLGHTDSEARKRIERVQSSRRNFKSVEDILIEIYRQENPE